MSAHDAKERTAGVATSPEPASEPTSVRVMHQGRASGAFSEQATGSAVETLASLDVPFPIPYQGSKRKLAPTIMRFLPTGIGRFYEPFCGSAAMALAVASTNSESEIKLNDNNRPLAELWDMIAADPHRVADTYDQLWRAQLGREREYYDAVRDRFNRTHEPELLLYLLARCVKAAVRYNAAGDFNQSPDNRRLGSRPERMRDHVLRASKLLNGRTVVSSVDYVSATQDATPRDLVYMDPPYQGVSTARDRRYRDILEFEHFAEALGEMNNRSICYIVSYDGRCGSKTYGRTLPEDLELTHLEVAAGRSTQSTLLGSDDVTFESLYLSPALVERLGDAPLANAPYASQASLW